MPANFPIDSWLGDFLGSGLPNEMPAMGSDFSDDS